MLDNDQILFIYHLCFARLYDINGILSLCVLMWPSVILHSIQ